MKGRPTHSDGDTRHWISRPLGPTGARAVRGRVELYARPDDAPRPFAILSHGFRSWMSWAFFPTLARRLAAAGFVVARFDYSGNGIGPDLVRFTEREAFAHDTYSRELEDLAAVRTALVDERSTGDHGPRVDPARGVILGHSRGAGIALIHAAERGDYRALCAWAGIFQVASWSEEKRARWRERGSLRIPATGSGEPVAVAPDVIDDADRHRARFDLEARIAELSTPTLFVHGDRDEGIPVPEIERLAALAPPGVARVAVVPHAGHGMRSSHPLTALSEPLEQALERTRNFLVSAVGA